MRPPARFTRQWDRLPDAVRSVVEDEAAAVSKELRSVRRPRDLRRLVRDPATLTRISDPLAPGLDRIVALVAKGTVPLPADMGGVAVAATGVVGAALSSALEVCGILGIEAPPAAAAAAGAAGTVAIAAEVVEFYLIACVASAALRAGGRGDDPAVLRRVLLEAYLGDGAAIGGSIAGIGFDRVARALVRRTLPRLAPVAGIPVAGWSSYRDLSRAKAAVARVLAEGSSSQLP